MNLEKKILLVRVYSKLSWVFCSSKNTQDKMQLDFDENTTIKELLDQLEPLYLESIGRTKEQEEVVEETPTAEPVPEQPMSVFELLTL